MSGFIESREEFVSGKSAKRQLATADLQIAGNEPRIRQLSKPMGVAVFRSDKRMPRVYRSLQPMLDGMVSVFEDGMK